MACVQARESDVRACGRLGHGAMLGSDFDARERSDLEDYTTQVCPFEFLRCPVSYRMRMVLLRELFLVTNARVIEEAHRTQARRDSDDIINVAA